jgi:hypothetical protein
MSIQEISSNFKRFVQNNDILSVGLFVALSLGSFLLGRASVGVGDTPASVREGAVVIVATEPTPNLAESATTTTTTPQVTGISSPTEGGYVASKSGEKYHLPWCSGAKSIKEENKIWFKTKEEAEAAGYTPAANCKGI